MDGVIYLNVGDKHLRNLTVSLMTLRDHWAGPVAILSGDDFVQRYIDTDDEIIDFKYDKQGRHGGGPIFAKTLMHHLSPFDRTIYLDCDTTIHGDISELFPPPGVINWTQFSTWTTAGRTMQRRIEAWRKILPEQVAEQKTNAYPAINTGVIGFSKTCHQIMDEWHKQTSKNVSYMCDELCAQLLAYDYPHRIFDQRFNATPKYSWADLGLSDLASSDVRIIHNHGNKGLKADKASWDDPIVIARQSIWLTRYFKARRDNYAGMNVWDDTEVSKIRHPVRWVNHLEEKYQDWLTGGGS